MSAYADLVRKGRAVAVRAGPRFVTFYMRKPNLGVMPPLNRFIAEGAPAFAAGVPIARLHVPDDLVVDKLPDR